MAEQIIYGEPDLQVEGGTLDGPSPTDHPGVADYEPHYTESLGAYMHTLAKKPLLSAAEERRLAYRAQSGSQYARDKLIEHNMRLVIHHAKRFRGRGLEFEELIQEGMLGLIRAIEKFDPDQGYKLSTYATWWINQKAGRAINDKGRTVRIPVHYHERLRKLSQAERRLAGELGREPTTTEIADELGTSAEKVRQMVETRLYIASLDAPVSGDAGSDGGTSALADFLADEELGSEMVEGVAVAVDRANVRNSLAELPEPSRSVLILRYGLDGKECRTLQQIADWLGVSREVVRQYQKRAEKQLAHELRRHGGGR